MNNGERVLGLEFPISRLLVRQLEQLVVFSVVRTEQRDGRLRGEIRPVFGPRIEHRYEYKQASKSRGEMSQNMVPEFN